MEGSTLSIVGFTVIETAKSYSLENKLSGSLTYKQLGDIVPHSKSRTEKVLRT